jgi:uncharacterized protein
MLQWLTGATLVTGFGLVVVAVIAAAFSYLIAGFAWRFVVAGKRARRLSERKARRERMAFPDTGIE